MVVRQAQGGLKLTIKGRKRPGGRRFPPPRPTPHPPMNTGIGRGEAIAPHAGALVCQSEFRVGEISLKMAVEGQAVLIAIAARKRIAQVPRGKMASKPLRKASKAWP